MKGSIENYEIYLKTLEGKIIPNPKIKGYNGDSNVLNRKGEKKTYKGRFNSHRKTCRTLEKEYNMFF